MEQYAFPRIGSRPVSQVDTADVLEILTPIWHVKAATARAVRQRIRAVLEWAIALDLRSYNPCDRVLPVLGPQNDIVTHLQALPHQEVAAAIETALAHVVQNKVEAAYARFDLFERRRLLMDDWARYLGADGRPAAAPARANSPSRVPLSAQGEGEGVAPPVPAHGRSPEVVRRGRRRADGRSSRPRGPADADRRAGRGRPAGCRA